MHLFIVSELTFVDDFYFFYPQNGCRDAKKVNSVEKTKSVVDGSNLVGCPCTWYLFS